MKLNFRTISVFLVLAVLTRSAVPVGYMLSSVEQTSGFSLQLDLCPTQNNFDLDEVSADINVHSHLSHHKKTVDHGHTGLHSTPEMSKGKPHQGHSDNLTSHDSCHLWSESSASTANIELTQWKSDLLSIKALSVYRNITSNRNIYNRKQTRAPPLRTLS